VTSSRDVEQDIRDRLARDAIEDNQDGRPG
jgi:hypothetical protein